MKKLIYKLILKYPLIILLLKTPLKKFFIKYMTRFLRSDSFDKIERPKSLLQNLFNYIFWREYYSKLKNPKEMRRIQDLTIVSGDGRRWAENNYNKHFKNLENLKNQKDGFMIKDEANPIFTEIISFIKNNNLENDKKIFIIQIGSSSGMDLKFLYDQFSKLNYISTDVNDEILDFQKEKYTFTNFKFFKCHAEEIDQCFEQFNLKEKKIILFSIGSATLIVPYLLNIFFAKIKCHKNLILFLQEPIDSRFIKTSREANSQLRNFTSFTHNYKQYAKKNNLKIIQEQITKPYSKNDPIHANTEHYYLCCKTN